MLAKKKKLSKKEIQEDKLVTSYFKTQQFFEKYQQKIIIGAVSAAVIIIVLFIYTNKVEQNNLAATTQLSRIMDVYNSGSFQEAIDGRPGTNLAGLNSIVDEYGSTEQGQFAKILLANSHYYLGDYEVAEEIYSSYSGGNPIFKASALAGRASCRESKGEFEDAADLYLDASKVSVENPSNADYLLKAGVNYQKSGDLEKSHELFQTIKDDYSNSQAATTASRYLGQ